MNMKTSSHQPVEYLTKVKKVKSVKTVKKGFVNESSVENKFAKMNFKQYLENIKEEQNSSDEFTDIPLLTLSAATIRIKHYEEANKTPHPVLAISLGPNKGTLELDEIDMDDILSLGKDESFTVIDEQSDCWHITRSINNQLIIESREYSEIEFSGKFKYDDIVKKLKQIT
jgi:hypothetical protein